MPRCVHELMLSKDAPNATSAYHQSRTFGTVNQRMSANAQLRTFGMNRSVRNSGR
jgi:hypothetical protein